MTEYAGFDDLLDHEAVSEDIALASGKVVQVRGLSRYEYMLASAVMADGSKDVPGFEVRIVLYGMVTPKLSEAQVKKWQRTPGAFADFQAVHEAIMRLSGLREGADKSSVRDVRPES